MFTGLVVDKAEIVDVEPMVGGIRITLEFLGDSSDWSLGESIALNGCCLTVVRILGERLSFEAGRETLDKTTLGDWKPGAKINFERALQVGDRLGGHFLSGHVDGLGRILESQTVEGVWRSMRIQVPIDLAPQIASKGSIGVDGVSLTVNEVADDTFSVFLIPHTLERTNLGERIIGDRVNLETDLLAKYVQRAILYHSSQRATHE